MSLLNKFKPFRWWRDYMVNMTPHKASRVTLILRLMYFFSAGNLLLMMMHNHYKAHRSPEEIVKKLEAGQPVIVQEDDLWKLNKGSGVTCRYTPEKGWQIERLHRDEYLHKLRNQALEDARKAQLAALREGRELPPEAVLLLDKDQVLKE